MKLTQVLLSLTVALVYGWALTFLDNRLSGVSRISIMRWYSGTVYIYSTLLYFIFKQPSEMSFSLPEFGVMVALVVFGLLYAFGDTGNLILFKLETKHGPGGTLASLALALVPVFYWLISFIVYGKKPEPQYVIGGMIIIMGIIVCLRGKDIFDGLKNMLS